MTKRSVLDLSLVWSGTLVGAFAGIATQIILARKLGAEDYGVLSNALALIGIAVPLAVFGIPQYWLKAFGEEGWGARRWLRPSLRFLKLSSVLTLIVLALWAFIGPNDSRSQYVIIALLAVAISMMLVEVVGSKLQLEQRYGSFSALGAVTPFMRLLVAVGVLFLADQEEALSLTTVGYMGASILVIAVLFRQLRALWYLQIDLRGHREEPARPNHVGASVGALVANSWVFGAAGVLYLAWAQGHVAIANYALGSVNAGTYNAALVIMNAVCLLPTVAFSKLLLPKIHRWAAQDFGKLRIFNQISSASMLGFGVLTAIAVYFSAPVIIGVAYGEQYDVAVAVLQILALTIPMRFLGYNAGAMLRTKRFMKVKVTILILAVLFNLVLAYLFIPRWGVLGLAATVPITEFALVSAYVYFSEVHYFREGRG